MLTPNSSTVKSGIANLAFKILTEFQSKNKKEDENEKSKSPINTKNQETQNKIDSVNPVISNGISQLAVKIYEDIKFKKNL